MSHQDQYSPSLFQRLLQDAEHFGLLRISFEDLSGITHDVPDFRLDDRFHWHTDPFCVLAKMSPVGFYYCRLNKRAANRCVVRNQHGVCGSCHLGLTDHVEPLMYHGLVLGLFYYGSVLVDGQQANAECRIKRFSSRHDIDPQPALSALHQVPIVSTKTLSDYAQRLKLIIDLSLRIAESAGIEVRRYRTAKAEWLMLESRHISPVVEAARQVAMRQLHRQLKLSDAAAEIGCSADYLSRAFKKHLHCTFGDYVLRLRIDRAKRLLAGGSLSVGEIAYQLGFPNQGQFARVFKRVAGLSPLEYRRQCI